MSACLNVAANLGSLCLNFLIHHCSRSIYFKQFYFYYCFQFSLKIDTISLSVCKYLYIIQPLQTFVDLTGLLVQCKDRTKFYRTKKPNESKKVKHIKILNQGNLIHYSSNTLHLVYP
jgi:hypothetical protein